MKHLIAFASSQVFLIALACTATLDPISGILLCCAGMSSAITYWFAP